MQQLKKFLLILSVFKKTFDFYIKASIHVSFATMSLTALTYHFCTIPLDFNLLWFVFFSTLFSYNLAKYLGYIKTHRTYKFVLKSIITLSLFAVLICSYLFFKFNLKAQLNLIFFSILNLLYMESFSKRIPNLRNLAGIKIYIVCFCWAGVTMLTPALNADLAINLDILIKFFQRFTLVLLLILIFEIYDLKYDNKTLKTVPQTIGIQKTKMIVYLLSLLFYLLEFFKQNDYHNQWFINLILCATIAWFTYTVNDKKGKYFTVFWVESTPILWLLLVRLLAYL